MTGRAVGTRSIVFGSMGILGFLGMLAMAAEEATLARDTFMGTAERFGIWAAISVGLVVCAVVGFGWLLHFTVTTMRDCIDDNTLAFSKLKAVMKNRPCLHDSDIDKIDDDSGEGITDRVLKRRQARQERKG